MAALTFDAIHALAAGLPGVTIDIKWCDNRVYSVGEKMFLICRDDAPSEDGFSFKVSPERFLELTDRPGITPAPYLARHHWVMLNHPGALPAEELAGLIQGAYQAVAARLSKKLRSSLGLTNS